MAGQDRAAQNRQPTRQLRPWRIAAVVVLVIGFGLAGAGALVLSSASKRESRQAFQLAASTITRTVTTSLRRDTDLVSAARGILTMEPNLTPSQFDLWGTEVTAGEQQSGTLGTVFVRVVPARRVAAFIARRGADPEFVALLGTPARVPLDGRRQYCLIAGTSQLSGALAATMHQPQGDWCNPRTGVGSSEARRLALTSATGQSMVYPASFPGLPMLIAVAPAYRAFAQPTTAAQRLADTIGWVVSAFQTSSLQTAAVAGSRGYSTSLYHRNPGGTMELVASRRAAGPQEERTSTTFATGGQWRIVVAGQGVAGGLGAHDPGLLVLIAGTVMSLLLFLLLTLLGRSRERALRMVEQRTGQLRHQALHDALTGLPNRVLALDRAEQMLARARRSREPVAALYIDIDGFKQINDTFGHSAGDEFLRVVADRIETVVRESDTAARLSGDEFVVLVEGSSTVDAGPELVAERLIEVLREPYDLNGQIGRQLAVTASIGLAHGIAESAEELLANADVALNLAKTEGKNRVVVFRSGMQTAVQDRLRLELDLADAMDRDELFLVFQPTFDLRSERAIGVEALLRWRHPVRGVIPPDVFIPIAEASGQIVPIGRWVLEQACSQAAQWHADGHPLWMSVNVSGVQLDSDDLFDDVSRALARSGLPAESLTLEITETTLMRDADASARRLTALKELGVRIAIDDFGTGYSSLAYLRQFPVDALKIDRSFINGVARSKQSAALIHTLVRLGKTLELETLAEGIEDRDQLRALQRQHCDQGQGFLFARPLEVEAIEQFLQGQSESLTVG